MKNEMQPVSHQDNDFSWSGDIFDQRFYNITKRILSILGQWPYQLPRERNIKFFMVFFYGVSALGLQMIALSKTGGKLDLFVACFTPLGANAGCMYLISTYHFHHRYIKRILDLTRENWESMRGLPQIRYLQEHGDIGRLFTLAYSIATYIIITGWILTPLIPKLLDAVAPLNESRPRLDVFPIDYMVDPDKFFWPIFFHLGFGIFLVLSILVAFDSMYMVVAQHASGMFEMLRYDMENILQVDLPYSKIALHAVDREDVFFHSIVSCIKRHKKIIQYVNAIQSTCEWPLLTSILGSALMLIFTGFLTVAKSTPREDVLRMALFTIAQIYHVYCITLPGHWIACESSLLSDAAYNCKWHMMSIRSRKLIIMFIRANMNPCVITAGKIYIMSMENFTAIIKTSMSYLAVLTSLE